MDTVKNFISTLMSTVSNCSLYSKDHIAVDELTRKSLMILEQQLAESGGMEIMLIEDDLVINKISFRAMGPQINNLKKRLKRKNLSRIEFLSGITFTELKQFISEILEIGKAMPSFSHIKTGVLNIQLDESRIDDDFNDRDISNFVLEQIETVKGIYQDISQSRQVNIIKIDEVIGNFVSACRKQTNILKLLTYAKSREEYSYIHATNVSVLSIFQMETLGVKERLLLRDIGIAGLFHDIGKLFISEDTLGKSGLLEEKDWESIKLHPLYGAKFVSSIDGLPSLVPIVAFQHHLRYDNQGYPELCIGHMKQHIIAQVVAISDCFDALRSTRPYKKGFEIKEIIPLMRNDAAKAFNPFLLENFFRRMYKALLQQ